MPAYVAEIVTGVEDGTGVLDIGNVAFIAPAGTVTDAGTVATAGFELDRATVVPSAAAFPERFTRLAVLVTPPTRLTGDAVTELSAAGRTVSSADRVTPP
jgi:hypothetical protein